MAGRVGAKYNALRRDEEFALADAVRALSKPFAEWTEAISYFTQVVQRPVTKANMEGICKDLNIEVSRIVATQKGPMANMASQIEDLMRRVESLEAFKAEILG